MFTRSGAIDEVCITLFCSHAEANSKQSPGLFAISTYARPNGRSWRRCSAGEGCAPKRCTGRAYCHTSLLAASEGLLLSLPRQSRAPLAFNSARNHRNCFNVHYLQSSRLHPSLRSLHAGSSESIRNSTSDSDRDRAESLRRSHPGSISHDRRPTSLRFRKSRIQSIGRACPQLFWHNLQTR